MLKALLLIEFSLAYFLPAIFLGCGIVFGIFLLVPALLEQQYLLSLGFTLMVMGGSVGLLASIQLLCKCLEPDLIIGPPRRLFFYVIAGILSLIGAALVAALTLPDFAMYAMLLPIPVSIHLVYLNREYFWPGH